MSRFNSWMNRQPEEFIKVFYPDLKVPEVFRNRTKAISLKELQELDNKFINNPEGDINGSTNV